MALTPAQKQAAYRERQKAATAGTDDTVSHVPADSPLPDEEVVTSGGTVGTVPSVPANPHLPEPEDDPLGVKLTPSQSDVEPLVDEVVDGRYRGFEVAEVDIQADAHRHLTGSFYVRSPRGTIGLVPFPGSTVVWPWEAGWEQDLHRGNRPSSDDESVTADLAWLKSRSS